MKFLKAYMLDIGEFLKQTGYLPSNVEPVRESKRLPMIAWAQAGNWQEICDTSQYGYHGQYVETDAKGIFALRVKGDSMEGELYERTNSWENQKPENWLMPQHNQRRQQKGVGGKLNGKI